ncbi:MAG TPA: DUF4055 domain-containing protein, partial [Pseudorhodoferax sp.]|nr:DUF4055 domain-containing protein [Pseudorhodoferax sp.]
MALAVNDKSPAVKAMAGNWPVIEALLGGTAAMRAAGETYLPKQPREDSEDYAYRLGTATLFPAYGRTVGVMAGKPFSKEVTLAEDTPPKIAELTQNVDGEGRSLHAFASDLMSEAVSFGFGGILVDFTRTQGQARTQAEEKALGARPYWIHIKHDQILGWKVGKVNGVATLTQLRIAETADVDDGAYGAKTVSRVRVLTPGAFELWEAGTSGYTLIDSGEMAPLKAIPFVPIYGIRKAFMRGHPPLLDLAHQNVKHWQHQSDQDDSIRFARKRLLVLIGLDGQGDSITAGSNYAMELPTGGDAKVVQGSAESVTVGRSELEALEAQMIQTGAELLASKPGQRTATEAANDAEANKSELQRIVETFEDSLDQALQFTALWLGLPEGGHASLFKDFAAGSLSEATAQLLLSLQQGGVITKETLIREQQRRGILAPDLDPAEELAAVEEEGPALGGIGTGD